jgi:hypothetical protein
MPNDTELTQETIEKYDEVRNFFFKDTGTSTNSRGRLLLIWWSSRLGCRGSILMKRRGSVTIGFGIIVPRVGVLLVKIRLN